MTYRSEQLVEELKSIRRGRGLHHGRIEERVGPELRRVCGVTPGDTAAAMRTKIVDRLGHAIETLPAELGLSARAALGIHPETYELLQLQERVNWLAAQLRRDVRTARRRVDEASGRLAEALVSGSMPTASGGRSPGWHVAFANGAILLDGDGLVAVEWRDIVADRDALERITLGWSLRTAGGPAAIGIKILYGGVLTTPEQPVGSRRQLYLTLPRPLRATERHQYALITQIPASEAMRAHYAYFPMTRCDRYHLQVRFDPERAPDRVWRVADAFHRDLDERSTEGEQLKPDPSGTVEVDFEDLTPGYGYGVQWT
ncbi:MAG TPA: hypothetical protein VLM05_22335 [Mycobacteriales bacterium]|nr:hypothetical protein [Mycobacteriales bacterium]